MLHTVISQKIELLITSAVRTTYPAVTALNNIICHVTIYPMVRFPLTMYIRSTNDINVRH
jgi:hypothetical protein